MIEIEILHHHVVLKRAGQCISITVLPDGEIIKAMDSNGYDVELQEHEILLIWKVLHIDEC